ncbi:MAG TPA: transporter [Vicinamibacterales bacterium]
MPKDCWGTLPAAAAAAGLAKVAMGMETTVMKRAILAMLVTMCPLAVAAQEQPAQQPAGVDAATATPSATSTSIEDANAQPVFARRFAKRRGSVVGYIEDASVGKQFRIRFDSGRDMTSPDRAEFFYAKCGCYRSMTGQPAFDPNAPGPGPGVVAGLNYQQLNLLSEYSVGRHASVFVELPFRWIKPTDFLPGTGSFSNQSGLGDITVGTKVALSSTNSHDITVMVRGSIPTGDSTKGLGTDHGSIEPALLVRQTLGGRAQIEGMFGEWHPTGSSQGPLPGNGNFAGDILYYGIGPSIDIVQTRNVHIAPVVELVGWHVLSGYDTSTFFAGGTGDASGLNIVNLKIGGRLSMVNGGSIYVGYGFALTSNQWYDHILRLEYRTRF